MLREIWVRVKNRKIEKRENLMSVTFQKTEVDIKLMAIYICQLCREGVNYKVFDHGEEFCIEVRGLLIVMD